MGLNEEQYSKTGHGLSERRIQLKQSENGNFIHFQVFVLSPAVFLRAVCWAHSFLIYLLMIKSTV